MRFVLTSGFKYKLYMSKTVLETSVRYNHLTKNLLLLSTRTILNRRIMYFKVPNSLKNLGCKGNWVQKLQAFRIGWHVSYKKKINNAAEVGVMPVRAKVAKVQGRKHSFSIGVYDLRNLHTEY